ncbi:MAG: hypothetical protein IPP07_20560 [Holophagales bacterium]|nr:hypothetical protein [Holophagales bacterium]
MAGKTRANNSIGKLSATGQVNVFNTAAVDTHAILDVSGYFLASPSYRQSYFYSPEMHLLSRRVRASRARLPPPSTCGSGRPVAQESVASPSAVKYLVSDHLGAPFLATNSTPAITWRVEYEPFGNVYGSPRAGAASDVRLRLPGQEYRETSPGRYYNVFRWYRPDAGQYTQPDPIWNIARADPALVIARLENERTDNALLTGLYFPSAHSKGIGTNLFAYVSDNPTGWIDQDGLAGRRPEGISPGSLFCALRVYAQNKGFPVDPSKDKWKHCFVSCVMYHDCGFQATVAAGLGKEVRDALGFGTPSFWDFMADLTGTGCGSSTPSDKIACMRCCRCRVSP